MKKTNKKPLSSLIEYNALILFLIIFIAVMLGAWTYAMKLRQSVILNNSIVTIDPSPLIEIEKIRNLVDSHLANGRSSFLLGSKLLFEKQRQDKKALSEALDIFQTKHNLPEITELVKKIQGLQQQQELIFDQAMQYRDKQTESKIVGQFYQSKNAPLVKQINDQLNEIRTLHSKEFDRIHAEAKQAAMNVELQIPTGMKVLTGLLGLIFLGLSLVIIKMTRERARHQTERERLFKEAKAAILARDEFIAAISHDLKEPLSHLNRIAQHLPHFSQAGPVLDSAELIKTSIAEIENLTRNISDIKTSQLEGLNLRMDQLSIDEVLEDARLLMQPLAKQRDVRLQFDSANPPVLAFLDKERVMRVLANLVGNAIKFSPKNSKVVVKVRSDQQFVNISVADSGCGIPEKNLSEIFDHFWQARKTSSQGAGVGLAVVKTIVEAHGGIVRVDSRLGHGSTFTFSLPRRRPAGAQIKKTPSARYATSVRLPTEPFSDGAIH